MTRLLRSFAGLVCLLLVSGLGLVVEATPATASEYLLCQGYDACRNLGMSPAGYKVASSTMYWQMYSGHNCTNYAAYRMVKSGLPNVRPWSGTGNASNWGHAEAAITNSVPAVGAIAWWDANVRPAGSAGHVAYVEQVVSPDEIIVSQDSWGGDFSWARITRVGGSWPSGFVHFNDVPLLNTAPPAIAGLAKVGAKLTASAGSWSQTGTTYAYQWRADGTVISSATGPALTVGLAQQDKKITVQVTATKMGYPTTAATSASTAAVLPGVITSTGAPTVTGTAQVGSTLAASAGTWTPTPDTLTYQWTADGVPVAGATAATFAPGPDQVGKALAVTVTAARAGYTSVSTSSQATTAVVRGTFTVTTPPSVSVPVTPAGRPQPGQTLTLDTGSFTPADADVRIQWVRGGVAVPGMTGTSYPVTAADLGQRIKARVILTKPGYDSLWQRTPLTPRVKSVPTMTVTTTPGTGRMRVGVTLAAPGVTAVPGVVRIWSGGRLLAEVPLRGGSASTTLTGLPAGTRNFSVRYPGSDTVTQTVVFRSVRIG
ncbi:MAG: CHAP domain-containing protein [Nocardioidaceae bacterium]